MWADGAYTGEFRRWAEEEQGWRVEVPYHRDRQLWRYGLEEKPRGFQILPRRWVVERTFAWLSQVRRLSKDYERLPEMAEATLRGDEPAYAAQTGADGVKSFTPTYQIRCLQNSF